MLCKDYGYNSVGPGWKGLLEELDENITKLVDTDIVVINQIKEKFGTLRVYAGLKYDAVIDSNISEKFFNLVQTAEEKSRYICENCGRGPEVETRSPGKSKFGWVQTLCKECHNIRDNGEKLS